MLPTTDLLLIAASVCGGLLIGAFYFSGLSWTVRRMPYAPHPLNLYFGSLIVRLVSVLSAFYGMLMFLGWAHLVAGLIGFMVARQLLIHRIGRAASNALPQREAV